MNGFIANTDPAWHALLLARQRANLPLDEVNFWKPSETATFKALQFSSASSLPACSVTRKCSIFATDIGSSS